MQTTQMISTHPDVQGNINETLVRCLDACISCAQTCLICADACMAEDMVADLRQCIRLNLDCADTCTVAAKLGARRTGSNEIVIRQAMELCAVACMVCGEECARHADKHEHCRICAEECHRCEALCREAARSIVV